MIKINFAQNAIASVTDHNLQKVHLRFEMRIFKTSNLPLLFCSIIKSSVFKLNVRTCKTMLVKILILYVCFYKSLEEPKKC